MRFNKTAIKGIAATLVLGQLNMALQPLYAATREDKGASSPMVRSQIERMQALQRDIDAAKARKAQESLSPADQASQRLARVEELVRDLAFLDEPLQAATNAKQQDQIRAIGPNLKARLKPLTAEQKAQRHDRRQQLTAELKGLLSQQVQDQAAVRAEFAQTRQTLLDRKLPAEILARHDEAVAKFEQHVAQFNQSASKAQQGDAQALAELQSFFDQNPTKRKAAPVDPAKLPWRTPEPTKRLPAETQTAWFQNLYANKGTRLAQVGNSLEGLEFVTPPEPGVAPTAADLAETPETQRTAAIKAKALELGNNPVNIQNWVRNNVEWVPTWGAIQSAQDTLDKKRGNAIDIASLEIALLRAAKIPARYQFGTIELPAEQVMNWVGGVTKPEAAQQLLGQGGIANRGLIEGGRISKIRMEHAWVQAYVNWLPSRGAKQGSATQHPSPQGQRNAWVPLDPSFKQYQFSDALNLTAQVPVNAQEYLDAAKTGANLNEAEGSIQNLNVAAAMEKLRVDRDRIKAHLDAHQASNGAVTTADVIGKKIMSVTITQVLAAQLPYGLIQAESALAAVPAALQHRFRYELYASQMDKAEGASFLTYTEKVSQLVGKRLTLTYLPATQADTDLLNSYLPKPHSDGTPIHPEELPTSLPGYLLKMKAELRLDGQVVATGGQVLTMGADLFGEGGFTQLGDINSWDLSSDDSHTVGQATALGISAQGVSKQQLDSVAKRLEVIRNKLQIKSVDGLTGEMMAGDLLTAAMWGWFAANEAQGIVIQRNVGVVEYQGLSYGLFHGSVKSVYSWGVVRSVNYAAVNFDIGHLRSISWDKANNRKNWVSFNLTRGQGMSSLEHSTPEKFFNRQQTCRLEGQPVSTLPACPVGMSAVKAIGMAMGEGQKVFKFTPQMYADEPGLVQSRLPQHSVDTKNRVLQALAGGLEVTIHERPLTRGSWHGAGYTTIDPETGAGGYLVEDAGNGGLLELIDNLQKYLFTPHIVGFSYGAGFKAFADTFGNFAGLFSFIIDIILFSLACSGDELIATILIWTIITLVMSLWLFLIATIFALAFIEILILSIFANLLADFVFKPAVMDTSCRGGS